MSYLPTAMMQERLDGTVKQAFRFLLNSTLIGLLFNATCLAFALSGNTRILQNPSMGLWPMVMCDIVIECNKSPELARGLCFLPIQIKSKYYPWALLALFSIFFGLQIDLFIGVIVGYMNIYNMLKKFEISSPKAKALESRFPFKRFNQMPDFVITDGNSGLPTFVRTAPPLQSTQRAQNSPAPSQSAFQAFGGRGQALGTAINQSGSSSRSSSQSYGSTSTNTSQQSQQQSTSNLAGKSVLVKATPKPENLENEGHSVAPNTDQSQQKGDYQKVRENTEEDEDIEESLKVNHK